MDSARIPETNSTEIYTNVNRTSLVNIHVFNIFALGNVWHGTQEPWHNWDKLAGRFVSEFGMEGYPDIRTVDYWLDGDAAERYPQSKTNNNHNKADGFERRLEVNLLCPRVHDNGVLTRMGLQLYLVENFKHSFQMDRWVPI